MMDAIRRALGLSGGFEPLISASDLYGNAAHLGAQPEPPDLPTLIGDALAEAQARVAKLERLQEMLATNKDFAEMLKLLQELR